METKDNLLETEAENKELVRHLHLSLLREGKDIIVSAIGMSMYPFVKTGDRLKIASASENEIKIGDLIAVDRKDKEGAWFFVHRVVKIVRHNLKTIYFTKGDFHKKGLDNPITIESIVGKVIHIQRRRLEMKLELPSWRRFNKVIAKMSLEYPRLLHFLLRYINLIIEWRLFLFKVKNRFKKRNPLLYNTEKLLLICSRRSLNEGLKNKAVDLINEGLYWEHFCGLAMRGGVTALVYNTLKLIASDVAIPRYVLDRLKSAKS